MKRLPENWITEHLIDFEYKKYMLLTYLQMVNEHFKEQKLYPDLADLIEHYKNLVRLKQNTSTIENGFKKTLKGFDFKTMSLQYEETENNDLLDDLKQIIDYSEPLIAREVNKGKEIFDYAEKHIYYTHLGILPLYKNEGYFVLHPHNTKHVHVYAYQLSKIKFIEQEVLGLNSNFVSSYTISIAKPIDKLKNEIIESNPDLPNPAVYLFQAKTELPSEETFLPIAKRLLYHQLSAAA